MTLRGHSLLRYTGLECGWHDNVFTFIDCVGISDLIVYLEEGRGRRPQVREVNYYET